MSEPRYRFLERLGEGGMGEVYLVEHLSLGRKEALKILRADLARDERFVLRFRREARATHRVQHPNIVAVHDFGRLGDGRFFLAMEYVQGKRLDVALKEQSPFPIARALDLLLQLTSAVAHAHAHGVIHRDLKPANLLLVDGGARGAILKVLDFGIAKLTAPEAGDDAQLTLDGEVFGTPKYMAPELFIAGQPIDHRADVYAIGCLAYEMLTGAPPFVGRRLEIMDGHLGKPVEPPTRKNPEVKPEVERLILRCLEKNPKKRLQSVHDLHMALELTVGGGGRLRRAMVTGEAGGEAGEATSPSETRAETRADGRSDGGDGTGGLSMVDQARRQLEIQTTEASEAILALGQPGIDLVFLLVDVREADHERGRMLLEQREIEDRSANLDTSSRQREAALRFALAELEFDSQADPDRVPADLTARVSELQAKLSHTAVDHERDVVQLTERAIALAAALAVVEERRATLYQALGQAVDAALERFRGEPSINLVGERLRHSRDQVRALHG